MRMVPHEETQIGWDGQHYEDVATLVGWCADEEHLTEARGATHDALIDLMGDRRRGAVGWKWKTGQEARDLLNEFTTNFRHLRGMLREYGGYALRIERRRASPRARPPVPAARPSRQDHRGRSACGRTPADPTASAQPVSEGRAPEIRLRACVLVEIEAPRTDEEQARNRFVDDDGTVAAFQRWCLDSEIYPQRGGMTGPGIYHHWFDAVHERDIRDFFHQRGQTIT